MVFLGWVKAASIEYAAAGNQLYVEYETGGQSISGNYTSVHFQLVCWSYNYSYGSYANDNPGCSMWAPGVFESAGNGNFDTNNEYSVLITTGWYNVAHNANGTKSFNIYGYHNTGNSLGSPTCSGTITFTTIPRAATLSSVTMTDDEKNAVFSFNNPGGFWIKYWLEFDPIGGSSATKYLWRTPNAGGSSYTFSLTEDERNKIRLSSKNSKTITIRFGIYTSLTSGTATYTNPSYKDQNITIINANPSIPYNISIIDINTVTTTLTGNSLKIIPGYSKIRLTIPTTGKAAGKKYATISKYTFNLTGLAAYTNVNESTSDITYEPPVTTITSIDIVTTDSRGYTSSTTSAVDSGNVIAYKPVKLNTFSAYRTEGGTSNNITFSYTGEYWNDSFGSSSNSLTAVYKYKQVGTSTWTTGTVSITPSTGSVVSGSIYTFSCTGSFGNVFDLSKSYEIQLIISDKLDVSTITITVPLAQPAMKVKGNSAIFPKDTIQLEDTLGVRTLLIDLMHPIGSLLFTNRSDNPGTYLGGSWEQIKDKFILGAGDSYALNGTGGNSTVTLTIAQMPSHGHYQVVTANAGGSAVRNDWDSDTNGGVYPQGANTGATGGGGSHNNMPPYITKYVFMRTS